MLKREHFRLFAQLGACIGAVTFFAVGASTAETTNSSSLQRTNRVATANVWDLAVELGFTPGQREEMDRIKVEYDAARAELRRVTAGDAPPDVKQAARQKYADRHRAITRRIGDLLSEEQEQRLAELRAGRDARAGASSVAGGATNSLSPGQIRRQSRPELTEDEYTTLARTLRAAYSKAPRDWPPPILDDEVKPRYAELGLLPPVSYPTNNLYSDAKSELGKMLFFDPRLSGSGQIACASCHDPELGWGDGRAVAFGHSRKALRRNAPTLVNIGHQETFFWDGRAHSLEDQVYAVLHEKDEMRSSDEHVHQQIARDPDYTNAFAKAFGTPEITLTRVMQAVATFERTITSRANAFDSFLRGDTNALSDSAVRGLHLFRTTARCANCHHGPTFSDGLFHNLGLSYYGRELEDLGRYQVTKKAGDVGAFRTPTLRNLSRTAPYMHNGLFDLDGVINMYNVGMPTLRRKDSQKDDPLFPTKSTLLRPLGLSRQEQADLKAFLEALTETRLRIRPPTFSSSKAVAD